MVLGMEGCDENQGCHNKPIPGPTQLPEAHPGYAGGSGWDEMRSDGTACLYGSRKSRTEGRGGPAWPPRGPGHARRDERKAGDWARREELSPSAPSPLTAGQPGPEPAILSHLPSLLRTGAPQAGLAKGNMGRGPVWGLQAPRGLEGDVRDHHSPASALAVTGPHITRRRRVSTFGSLVNSRGPGVHGNSISPASLVPFSGCSETGAGVGAVGEALQGSPELADIPPIHPPATGLRSQLQDPPEPPGVRFFLRGRESSGSHGGGGALPVGNGEQSAHSALQGSESKPPEPLSAAGTGGARTCPDPEGKKGAVTEPGSPRGAM